MHDERTQAALGVLKRHYERIDPSQALELLPLATKVSDIREFLVAVMRTRFVDACWWLVCFLLGLMRGFFLRVVPLCYILALLTSGSRVSLLLLLLLLLLRFFGIVAA
jgi:hypothetical protein